MTHFTGQLPEEVKYIGQDNYIKYSPSKGIYKYLYSDSATSCLIVAVCGSDIKTGESTVYFTHLSRAERFEAFFEEIKTNLTGLISLKVQGANPPAEINCYNNVVTLINLIQPLTSGESPFIKNISLSLGQGDPNKGWGSFGICVEPNSNDLLKTSNIFFLMNELERDPTDGVQSLFCTYGLKIEKTEDRLILHNVDNEFTQEEIGNLVTAARKDNFERVCDLTDEEILKAYSSTPQYEPAWYPSKMRNAGFFVKNYLLD